MTDGHRPAWSKAFAPEALQTVSLPGPLAQISREWAWGDSKGEGVRVAVIDSGIDYTHPAVGGRVTHGVAIEQDATALNGVRYTVEPEPRDMFGHGTACAGIIHSLAPKAELVSVRVLGVDGRGQSQQFAAGINWAIEQGIKVINMSLSTAKDEYFALFHRLADKAYFSGVALVAAVNNIPKPSYPSLYSSVFSVAAHDVQDPFTYYYNPSPPVEFGALGIDVKIAWANGSYMTSVGNSFAAPHIAGLIALIRAKHPQLTPFQLKTVLYSCATNAQAE